MILIIIYNRAHNLGGTVENHHHPIGRFPGYQSQAQKSPNEVSEWMSEYVLASTKSQSDWRRAVNQSLLLDCTQIICIICAPTIPDTLPTTAVDYCQLV